MQKIVEGIHQFQNDIYGSKQGLFEALAGGQQPLALFITCSDSRIDPNLLTQTEPGELFVLRNAGNIVPPYGAVDGGESATIEYAVSALGVKDIIICGHSQCGAMGGLLHPEALGELPAVAQWLTHASATAKIMKDKYQDLTDEAPRLATTVEQNVLVQLQNLKSHPSVAAALANGSVNLHGWVYKFETGQVFAHDDQQGKFVEVK